MARPLPTMLSKLSKNDVGIAKKNNKDKRECELIEDLKK